MAEQMLQQVKVQIENEAPIMTPMGSTLLPFLSDRTVNGHPVLGALLNNDVAALYHPLFANAAVRPLTIADPNGWQIYRWTLAFLLAKAIRETFPGVNYRVRHAYGSALYWSVQWHDGEEKVQRLKEVMQRIIAEDQPIQFTALPYDEALASLHEAGEDEKAKLLAHRNPPIVTLIRCGDFLDLCQGTVAHRTGVLTMFDLVPATGGFILNLPPQHKPETLEDLPPFDYLFSIFKEHAEWGEIIGLSNVGQLNEAILKGEAKDFVFTAEALHEKKLARIADQIVSRTPIPRLILIAGPSSAGKTTTAKRLMTQLRILGFAPLLLSTDDYFVGDADNPRDEQGNLDYEHINAMDVPRLNSDVLALLSGKAVHMSAFDFKKKLRYNRDNLTTLAPNGIIVMEGIHSLNPDLTPAIPRMEKFLIYISALTQLALDRNNRISTTDNRLLRRMVRDNHFRGYRAVDTLRRWDSVRAGERRWIFPHQHLADAVFNSALDYELAVLKTFASPLLAQIKPHDDVYPEARRLAGFLQNFISLDPGTVPGNSLLREHIGGSSMDY